MRPLPPLVTSPTHWLLGPSYYARRDPVHWVTEWARQYGEIFRVKSPFGQATMVTSPELARHVLADHYSHYQQKSQPYAVLRILMGQRAGHERGRILARAAEARAAGVSSAQAGCAVCDDGRARG